MNTTDFKGTCAQLFVRFLKEKHIYKHKLLNFKFRFYSLDRINEENYWALRIFDRLLGWSGTDEGYRYWYAMQFDWCYAISLFFFYKKDIDNLRMSVNFYKELFGFTNENQYKDLKEEKRERIAELDDLSKALQFSYAMTINTY